MEKKQFTTSRQKTGVTTGTLTSTVIDIIVQKKEIIKIFSCIQEQTKNNIQYYTERNYVGSKQRQKDFDENLTQKRT